MPLSAGRGQARRGWHGCLPAFSCCYACCFGLGDDRPPLPAALVDRGKWGRVAHPRLPRPRLRLCNFFHGRPLLGCGVSSILVVFEATRGSSQQGGIAVSEQIESQVISRRKLFLLVGLAAGFAVPVAVLTGSNAEAQQPEAQQPGAAPMKKTKKEKKAAPTSSAPAPTPSEKPKAQ